MQPSKRSVAHTIHALIVVVISRVQRRPHQGPLQSPHFAKFSGFSFYFFSWFLTLLWVFFFEEFLLVGGLSPPFFCWWFHSLFLWCFSFFPSLVGSLSLHTISFRGFCLSHFLGVILILLFIFWEEVSLLSFSFCWETHKIVVPATQGN